MKNAILILSMISTILSCTRGSETEEYTIRIFFPEDPITIMSSTDSTLSKYEKNGLNYFNIIGIQDNMFYMYYLSFGEDSNGTDLSQRLMFAYSNDLMHWSRQIPNKSDNVILENLADASVSYNSNNPKPFRLVCRKNENGINYLAMYLSKNGFEFEFEKIIFVGKYDTQTACIEAFRGYKLFTRLWNTEHTDRMIGVATFNEDNECIDSLQSLGLHYVYNPACSKIDENNILFLPSYLNNLETNGDDTMIVKSYVESDKRIYEITNNMLQFEKSPALYISPGLINYKGNKYISYQTKSNCPIRSFV